MQNRKIKFSKRGSVLIMALVGTLVLASVTSAIAAYFLVVQKYQRRQNLIHSLSEIQANFSGAIQSDAAWDKTKSNNTTPTTTPVAFALYDATGAIIYDAINASSGFTVGGQVCNQWTGTSTSTKCPIRVDLKWQQVASCIGAAVPSYQINGTYIYDALALPEALQINWTNYSGQLSFCRPVAIQSFSCIGGPPATACSAPDKWYCTSSGWGCGQIYN